MADATEYSRMIGLPSAIGFLTAREVAARLRLPLSTVYFLAEKGDLPTRRIGRALRFPTRAITALEEAQSPARRVLVVDDDAALRVFIRGILEAQGHLVVEAASVAEGLHLAKALSFDAFVVDILLPDGNGADVVKGLLTRHSLGQFIAITAGAGINDLEQMLSLGAITFMRKPLDGAQLQQAVQRALSNPGMEVAAS